MKTIALYMRLSGEDAREGESCSITSQRMLLLDYIKSHEEFDGWKVLEFTDDGYSGVSFGRPGVRKLLALAGGTVDCIIVKDFSRFGRNLVEVGDYLDQIFPFLGVRFIAVNEGYDSGQGQGGSVGLDVSLKAFVHEMYSRDVSEKIRSAKHAKMRRGEYQGTTAFYGYRRSETAKGGLAIDAPAAEVVRRIFHMAAEGVSPADIAVELNRGGILSPLAYRKENHTDAGRGWREAGDMACWTCGNVRRTLSDERYTGSLVSRKRAKEDVAAKASKLLPKEEWITAEDAHEPVVSKEMFARAQKALGHCRRTKMPGKPCQPFRGLLKCAYCGRALTKCLGKTPYYYCATRRALPEAPCAGVYMGERELEDVLSAAVRAQVWLARNDGVRQDRRTQECLLRGKLRECRKAAGRCKTSHAAAFEDYAEGRIPRQEYLSRKKEISGRQEEIDAQYADLSDRLAEAVKNKERETGDLCRDVFADGLTRGMLEEFVREVRVRGGDGIEIVWNFKG